MEKISPREVADAIAAGIERTKRKRVRARDFASEVEPLVAAGWHLDGERVTRRVSGSHVSVEDHPLLEGYWLTGPWDVQRGPVILDTVPEILDFVAEIEKELALR